MCRGEEHAQRDEEVTEDFCIARQRVGEEHVAEFAVLRFCDAANGYTFQCRKRAGAAAARDKGQGGYKANDEDQEVEIGQNLPCCDILWVAACESPEQEEREGEGDG